MRHRPLPPLIAAALVALAVPAAAGPTATAASTVRVSVDSNGQQFASYNDRPAVSANGRYVAFDQGISSVYVRDRTGGTTELITNQYGSDPDISADGNLVAFVSLSNLAPPAAGAIYKIYLFNRSTATFEVVSLNSTGAASAGYHSYNPAMSATGAVIAFESDGTDLVTGDTNGKRDVYVRNRTTGTTERISVSSSGAQGNGSSSQAAVSADGRFVAFQSDATNLVAGDTNGRTDVFIRNLAAGTTQRVSLDSAETQADDFSVNPDMSGNGRYVTFDSKVRNWPGSTGAVLTYVRDRTAGTTEIVSVSSSEVVANNRSGSGDPAISDSGRYVTFSSAASNLVPEDTDFVTDVYLRDRTAGTTTLLSVSTAGVKGNSSSRTPAMAGKASIPVVAFVSDATNLVAGDTNGYRDIFARKTA